ncbi:thymidine phosphorylase family protein [Massilia sp. TS11]|uniref:thymidine phosphorylase family protein n=1 Tax=Massilia sp. TS11 TaxID=2908003 RepID=UPI001EDB56BB|nr:thymidine phosphorylase family protein [Massilia sp. TS11]MCG2584541.1 thymidine phosphorylase family protein [Massilia sp. TS11]
MQTTTERGASIMRVKRLHIDTYHEPVIYMRRDCHVCRSEGFEAHSRIEVTFGERRVIATLNVVSNGLVETEEIGLSEAAWRVLGAADGEEVSLAHPLPLQSFSQVRAKLYGHALTLDAARDIMRDIVAGNYSDIEIAAFLTACAGNRMDLDEITALTRAMVESGARLDWGKEVIVDKHCVGGLPGNRTTLLVVPIVAACGLTIPKTSSRAITSPAGTADTMETLAPVMLDLARMRAVVAAEGGCIAWGGAVNLSPADDLLIRIERPLDLDSDGQLVASVLSKKLAAGSTHVLIDIPVGPTAKVRSLDAAQRLTNILCSVGQAIGLEVRTLFTDGSQPVGRGIGPALEAYDVLAVLQNAPHAPDDLRQRALLLSARILEMGLGITPEAALTQARQALTSGTAWRKFQAICAAQGGMREPPRAPHTYPILAKARCRIVAFDNRRLARIAKLAGAPRAPAAGILLHGASGGHFNKGDPIYTIHAESPGELAYARDYAESQPDVVLVEKEF